MGTADIVIAVLAILLVLFVAWSPILADLLRKKKRQRKSRVNRE